MAVADDSATTTQRTHRYLRLSLVLVVAALLVSVLVETVVLSWQPLTLGWNLLPSISHYFYTPARDVFVGALIAASVALLALSGRGAERTILDAAALFAPLIALVPTTLAPGTVPGVVVPCAVRCFPPEYEADAANGVLTYLVVGGLTILVALLLAALGQVSLSAVGFSLVVTGVVLVGVGATWLLARDAFLAQGHFVATIAFFALFAAVAVLNAFPRRGAPPATVFRVLYVVIAVALAAVLVVYIVLLPQADAHGLPIVLLAEAAALALFFSFWVVQGVEKWHETDPSIVAETGRSAAS